MVCGEIKGIQANDDVILQFVPTPGQTPACIKTWAKINKEHKIKKRQKILVTSFLFFSLEHTIPIEEP